MCGNMHGQRSLGHYWVIWRNKLVVLVELGKNATTRLNYHRKQASNIPKIGYIAGYGANKGEFTGGKWKMGNVIEN